LRESYFLSDQQNVMMSGQALSKSSPPSKAKDSGRCGQPGGAGRAIGIRATALLQDLENFIVGNQWHERNVIFLKKWC
jgi:hypothetical protein